MILQCTHKCFVLDRSVKPGQCIDIPDALVNTEVVKASFAVPETPEAKAKAEVAAAADQDRTALSATELKRRLDEIGVAYRGNASRDVLQRIYDTQMAARDQAAPPTE